MFLVNDSFAYGGLGIPATHPRYAQGKTSGVPAQDALL